MRPDFDKKYTTYGEASRGGGGRIIAADERHVVRAPQYGIDVALAQAALIKVSKWMATIRYAGEDMPPKLIGWYWALKDTCRRVGTSARPLSDRMRAACIKTVGEDTYQRILRANTDSGVPEVLRNLPKKPPIRKVEE